MEPLSNFHQGLCWSRKKIVNRIGGVGGKRYSHVWCNIPPIRARAWEEKWPRSSTCSLLQWSLGFGGLKTRCVTVRLRRWRLRRSRSRPGIAAAGCGRSRGSHRLVLRSSSICLIELQKKIKGGVKVMSTHTRMTRRPKDGGTVGYRGRRRWRKAVARQKSGDKIRHTGSAIRGETRGER